MKSNFTQRAITGIVFVVVLVGCILWGSISFSLLFTLITALSVHEFGHLMNTYNGGSLNKTITALGGAYLFLAQGSFCIGATDARIFLPYLFLLLYVMITELYLKKANPLGNWAFSMLSQLYIALPFALLNILAYHNSPEKGSVGGAVFSIASSLIFAHCYPFFSIAQWAGLAAVVVVFGTWGDLTESLMKRQLGIKDSGNILPGHGGMLDRFDSALMAIPAAVIYIYVLTL